MPPPTGADVESIALGIARAVEKAKANAEPPAADDDDDEHLAVAVATDAALVGARSGWQGSERARARTPRSSTCTECPQ